ncbi:MAG TPA: FMN-binding negative transcriptional regulator [Rhizomicrobium sp.]|jgi:transcriptional regulator|nr:FMN-binding negative transcriptional regulator [Rhizomicrobium sp.]
MMYRPSAFAVDDVAILHGIIRQRVFATIAAVQGGAVAFAYAPVILDAANGPKGGIRFHLAIANPLAKLEDGDRVRIGLVAADAYVSPDWYRKTVTVPTWNYVAVEGEGAVRLASRGELRQMVVDLSAQEEEKLLPKAPWLIGKMPPERVEALLNGIVGFSLSFERLEGKFKLSQDKTTTDRDGVIAALETRGDAASMATAKAMRKDALVPARWFGENWNAPICCEQPPIPVPVGQRCSYCSRLITATDSGIVFNRTRPALVSPEKHQIFDFKCLMKLSDILPENEMDRLLPD